MWSCSCGDEVPTDRLEDHLRLIHLEAIERWPDGEPVVVDFTDL